MYGDGGSKFGLQTTPRQVPFLDGVNDSVRTLDERTERRAMAFIDSKIIS